MSVDVLTWLVFVLISLRIIFRDALLTRRIRPWLLEAVSLISLAVVVGSLALIILTRPSLVSLLVPAAAGFFLVPLITLLRVEIMRLWALAGFVLMFLAALFRVNLLAEFFAVVAFSFLIMFFLRTAIFDGDES